MKRNSDSVILAAPTRLVLALAASVATALPFAAGILKNGFLELVLLAPVGWFLLATRTREHANRALLLLVSLCLTVTLCDLLMRPLVGAHLHYSPMNLYQRRLPTLPILGRWDAVVNYSGMVYGDLAAMSGEATFREPRLVEFRTDARGFRNDFVPNPVDMMVLGDSFAAGAGLTQTEIFAHALADHFQVSVYNLSYPGGPYDQYVNFAIETPTLAVRPGAELIWTIYTGNDLDDAGGEIWDIEALPWRKGLSAALVEYRTFRDRSPLRQGWEAVKSRWGGISNEVLIRSLPDGRPILFYAPQEAWGERSRDEVERHPNFPKLVKTFLAMKETARRIGVHMTIIVLPTKGEVYRWLLAPRSDGTETRSSGFAAAVIGACQLLALRCLDSKAYFITEAQRLFATSQELLWWRDDTHLNAQGHHALASFVIQEFAGRHSP